MKLTDFGILFVIIAGCIFWKISFQNDLLRESMYGNTMCNNIMDNIAEDALRNAVSYENYMPVADREELLFGITDYIGNYYMGMGGAYGEYLKKSIKLLLITCPDGYYMAGDKKGEGAFAWKEKKMFSEGKITVREKKVKEITEEAEKEYGIELLIPAVEGSSLANTIEDYQLLLVYETYPYWYQGKEYKKLLFSGAKIRHDIRFAQGL